MTLPLTPTAPPGPSLAELYQLVLGSRLAEQRITELSKAGEIPGHHSGLGHEAVGVGIGTAVMFDDCVQPSYRSGAALMHARGGLGVRELVLQGFGLIPGPREQHPGGPRTLRSTGILAGQFPMAVGIALAFQLKRLPSVVVSVIGDGQRGRRARVHEHRRSAPAADALRYREQRHRAEHVVP
jgi:TPP-dependent pyruvate/acetoin dehydrogenase alpha subunit